MIADTYRAAMSAVAIAALCACGAESVEEDNAVPRENVEPMDTAAKTEATSRAKASGADMAAFDGRWMLDSDPDLGLEFGDGDVAYIYGGKAGDETPFVLTKTCSDETPSDELGAFKIYAMTATTCMTIVSMTEDELVVKPLYLEPQRYLRAG